MALQTKTFEWGSYAYQSESNAYVLALTLTENSTDQITNKSNISYKLVLKSGSQNRFTGQIDSAIKLNNVQVNSGSKQISAAYNSSWVLLEGSADVTHNQDGSLEMPVEVSINTYNKYAPPDKILNWSWELTTIPRASSITSAGDVTLGGKCAVKWTPNSKVFRYKLKFSLGDWSDTTDAIHPDKVSQHTYEGYTIPLEVAEEITDSKTGTMEVVLITYADSGCKNKIGESKAVSFEVTVPENDSTRPTVSMDWELVNSYNGNALQGRTAAKVTSITASGKYGAGIKSRSFTIERKAYAAGATSDPLANIGEITIVATAVDNRGISGTTEEKITVLPYYIPRVVAEAFRCNADGTQSDTGEFLRISAQVDFSGVEGNSASLTWRYRPGGGAFNEESTLEEAIESGKDVTTDPLLEGTLNKEVAYIVEIIARDTVGSETRRIIHIPSEYIFRHKRPGGRGLGLGGYCETDDLLDVYWNSRIRKGLVIGSGVGSIYMSVTDEDPHDVFGGVWEEATADVLTPLKIWKMVEE